MNEFHNNIKLDDSPASDCLYISNKSGISSTSTKRDLAPEEERLAQVIVERVIPPFAHSLKLQAMVVYQADQEEMNCLMVNKVYRKESGSTYSEDMNTDLSDSGFLDTTFMTPLSNACPKLENVNGCDNSNSHSRRKRKLSHPCKIPQTTPSSSPSTVPNSLGEQPPTTPVPCDNSPVMCPVSNSMPVQPSSLVIPSSAMAPANPSLTSLSVPPLPESSEINKCTPPQPNGGLFLPVSAVTLLPHVSLFSLPMTVVSTLPRPILPRRTMEKPSPTRRILPTTLIQPSSPQPQQQSQSQLQPEINITTTTTTTTNTNTTTTTTTTNNNNNNNNHNAISNSVVKPILPKESDNALDDPASLNRRYAKSFICNQCRTAFPSLSLLCEHTFAVHKAFRCTICGANFTQRSNLQRHSLRHVGFKPFVCKICNKAYYRKDHLVRHIELSHPGCNPRDNLTVKLSSAESLDYLEQLKKCEDAAAQDPSGVVCQTVIISPPESVSSPPVPDTESCDLINDVVMSPPSATEPDLAVTLTPPTNSV